MRKGLKLCTLLISLCISLFSYAGLNDLIISEVCFINDSIIHDEYENYSDWIELYNTGAYPVNLFGLCLSDSPDNLLNYIITSGDIVVEAHSYKLLWADNDTSLGSNHIGFKLSNDETLTLYHNSTGIIDDIKLSYTGVDISIGRTEMLKTSPWKLFTEPTPGSENNTTSYAGYTSVPLFDKNGGFYSGNVEVNPSAIASETIYYTTNNYDPNPDSSYTSIYDGSPINITQTTIIRAQCYNEGYLPGLIQSSIYMIDETYGLPVWVTMTDPENLIGPKGIYNHPWNEGYAWEKFSQHQYFNNGVLKYASNSGLRIQGGNSVGMPKKSFRLHYRSQYGDSRLEYPLFSKTSVTSFNKIVFRAGYDDDLTNYDGTLLRDPLSADLWRVLGNLSSASEWAVLLLNGQYWGIYNIKESVDEDFIIDHLGTENFDMIRYQKSGAELKYGSMTEWNKMVNYFETVDFTLSTTYDSICKIIDMDNFLDLLAFIHCTQFRSWTWGCSAYKINDGFDKWKWTIWDTDRSFLTLSWNGFTEYSYLAAEKWANFMPLKLMDNKQFKIDLINRVADFINSYFLPDKVNFMLDSLKNIISPEIENDKTRWGSSFNWESNVDAMRNFLNQRPETLISQIKTFFSINNAFNLQLKIKGKGKIVINSLSIKDTIWDGTYFENIPVKITALPDKGYMFEKWSINNSENSLENFILTGDSSLTAYFIADTSIDNTIIINEIMYHPHPGLPSKEWIELYNNGDVKNISGWWISDNNANHKFKFPQGTYINSNDYLIVTEDISAFYNVYNTSAPVTGSYGLGANSFGLSNSGDCVKLYNNDSIIIDSVCYTDVFPWPVEADGQGPSLQLLNTNYDNSLAINWAYSLQPFATPGQMNKFNTTNITNYNSAEQYKVFPNPVKNNLYILFQDISAMDYSLSIYSLSGQLLINKNINEPAMNETVEINISDLEPGIYFIRLHTGNKFFSEKIIKL